MEHNDEYWQRAKRRARLAGAIVGVLAGVFYALYLGSGDRSFVTQHYSIALGIFFACAFVGGLLGFFTGPNLSVYPYRTIMHTVNTAPPAQVLGGAGGLIIALLISVLTGVLLGGLPGGSGYLISLAVTAVLLRIGVGVGASRYGEVLEMLRSYSATERKAKAAAMKPLDGQPVIVDTSALIDGRIDDVAKTGFLPGRLIIAHFVLEELQKLADSTDSAKRDKGKRGLNVANALKDSPDVTVEVVDTTFEGVADVDSAILRLAKERQGVVLTTDYNLNRLARLQDFRVLNVNDLANAVKPITSQGDVLEVTILKRGKEPRQGVAHLPDGTMVIVDDGVGHLNEMVHVTVNNVVQTPSGRLVFASINGETVLPTRDRRSPSRR